MLAYDGGDFFLQLIVVEFFLMNLLFTGDPISLSSDVAFKFSFGASK